MYPCTIHLNSFCCRGTHVSFRLREMDQEPSRSSTQAEPMEQRRSVGIQEPSYVIAALPYTNAYPLQSHSSVHESFCGKKGTPPT